MRLVSSVMIALAACGGDDATTIPDSPVTQTCQVDADCGAQFCNANTCEAAPAWNAAVMLGGGVPFAGSNQAGVALRGDDLEIVFTTDRDNTCADLWHATRASATDDFGTPTPLTTINDATGCDKQPVLRNDGLELYFNRSSKVGGIGEIFRATRASTSADFDAPVATSVISAKFSSGQTLSGDGLTLMYQVADAAGPMSPVDVSTRASTTDVFAAGAPQTDLGMTASAGLALSPDGRYLITVAPQTTQLQLHLASSGTFGAGMPITNVNTGALDVQPSITADGRTLYFSRRVSGNVNAVFVATRR